MTYQYQQKSGIVNLNSTILSGRGFETVIESLVQFSFTKA